MNERKQLLLTLFLVLLMVPSVTVYGYDGPVNITSATWNDTRVDPSAPVDIVVGPVFNGTTGNPVGFNTSALNFDGAADYVRVNNDASLTPAIISIDYWAYLPINNGANNAWMINKMNGAGTAGYAVGLHQGTNQLRFSGGTGALADDWLTGEILNINEWYHIVFLWNGTYKKLYIDGVFISEHAVNGPNNDAANLDIGKYADFNVQYYNGTLDEIRIYNRTLSTSEIVQHYNGIYNNDLGLVLHIDFDNEVIDQSGNGNNGTINGAPVYVDGWAFCPLTSSYNGTSGGTTVSLVNSTTGIPISHLPSTVPATYGVYNATVYPPTLVSTQNITYTGFIVDHYLIDLETAFTETEAGFAALITATGASAVDGHQIGVNDTLVVQTITMTWNTAMDYFYGSITQNTPTTITFNTVTSFLEDTYGITSASINTTAPVTWTTSTLDSLYNWFGTGNWIGGVLDSTFGVITVTGGYTLLLAIFSIAIYQSNGPYAVFAVWLFGWTLFATQVHGAALGIAIIMLVLGLGIALAKLFLDRRTT